MIKQILDVDPLTRTTLYHHYDPFTDETFIEEIQDVTPYLERNKRLQNDADYSKKGIKNEWWHVASIPSGVQMKWLREHGVDIHNRDHWPKVKRLLKDPDYRYLLTTAGKI